MNYTKPEVAVLGDAIGVIQQVGKGVGSEIGQSAAAYDLDE